MEKEKIIELMNTRQFALLKQEINEMNEVDLAEIIEDLDTEVAVRLYRMLKKDQAAEVFANFSSDMQQTIVEAISDSEIAKLLDEMFLDDAVDFIEELPAGVVKRVLKNATPEMRKMINQFLQYPEDSVGSVMTIEYIALKKEITVNQAFEKIRREGVDKETIYTCYVTDEKRALLGSVSVKDMLLADPESKMEDIMETNDIRAHTTDDREELANDFRRYGLLAIPVVDHEERLVGIVTVDDMVQVIEEENTEDFEKMAAITPSDSPYLDTNVMTLAKKRLPWLMLLMISATFTGTILSSFENAFAVIPALVTAIPMIMDTGGNSGSQSSTLVTRGLALEEIKPKDGFKVWLKELRVGLICGVCLAIVNMLRMLIMNCITDMSTAFAMSNILLCLTVSLALMCAVIVAKSVGCLLPLLAKMLGGDPAVMASPIITTIVDAISLIVYFALATIILGL